jgi:hypothetical protein
MQVPNRKKNYATPQLSTYGSIVTITQASGCGDTLDAGFPAGTKLTDLTCTAS